MAVCEICGHEDDAMFTITRGGISSTFDSFECAIHAMAPRCGRCRCRVLGHGVKSGSTLYCCDHCAQQASVQELASARTNEAAESVPEKQVARWKDDGGAVSS